MNKFDRAVNKKTCELIFENFPDQEVDEETYKQFQATARAMIRTEMRGIKQSDNPKSLYQKTWKTANKYSDKNKKS